MEHFEKIIERILWESRLYEEVMDLLFLSVGIIMIALAIFFLGKSEEEKEQI